jgi:hypothetical protein
MRRTAAATLALTVTIALGACKSDSGRAESKEAKEAKQAPAPGAFTWTEDPALDKIPAAPVVGEANGKPFKVATILFEPAMRGGWRMVIADKKLDSPTGILVGCQHIDFDLNEEPAAGKKMTRKMQYGGGYFQIEQLNKPGQTTSWNGDNAWALELTTWDAHPYDDKGSLFQAVGKASGKVAIVYKGGVGFKNSWAAGTFDNATIRYMGKPQKPEKKEGAPATNKK